MRKHIPNTKELRQRGFKVFIKHEPYANLYSKHDNHYLIATGMTKASIIPPGGKNEYYAYTYRSLKDQFNRKLGVRIALGRALKYMKANCDLDIIKEL